MRIVDYGPPRYAGTATGAVAYCPVLDAADRLQGYLWWSDAEGAASFVPLLVRGTSTPTATGSTG
ncbi:hypothetical protein GCM10010195_44960 [Kitasatospora griseola]|nr:hypothetical protein GCM10010195_44960 [Kitasatospora griseola]